MKKQALRPAICQLILLKICYSYSATVNILAIPKSKFNSLYINIYKEFFLGGMTKKLTVAL